MKSNRSPYFCKMNIVFSIIMLISLVVIIVLMSTDRKLIVEAYVYDPCGGCYSDNNPCKPCTLVIEMENYLGKELKEYSTSVDLEINVYNVKNNADKLKRIIGDDIANVDYPIVVVGSQDKILNGWEDIKNNLHNLAIDYLEINSLNALEEKKVENLLTYEIDENIVTYFGIDKCKSCDETKMFLEEMISKCSFELKEFDIGKDNNIDRLKFYLKEYQMSTEDVAVPIVFYKGHVLEDFETIEIFLPKYLEKHNK